MRIFLCLCLLFSVASLAACSSFKSSSSPSRWSGQSSKSSSSPFRSSSGGGEEEKEKDESQYHKDVKQTVASAVAEGAGGHEVMRQVGPVAAEHGITDWEGDPITYRAIGEGLAKGGLSVNDFDQVSRDISAGSDVRQKLLLEGYTASP